MFDQTLGLLDHHVGYLNVARGWLVKSRGDYFALNRTLHVGYFFGPLVNQQDNQRGFWMILSDRIGDGLQQHGFARARGRDDQGALAFAQRRDEIDDPRGEVLRTDFHLEHLVGIELRQGGKENLLARHVRRFEVDRFDFDQRKVALALFRRPNLAADGIAGAQVKLANL